MTRLAGTEKAVSAAVGAFMYASLKPVPELYAGRKPDGGVSGCPRSCEA